MELMYSSTRNDKVKLTASQAILKGLADDGGLFVPERIPALDVPMDTLADMSYQETAYEVMSRFFTDFTEDELKDCIKKAYDSKFDTPEIAPLVDADGAYYLELFHGPTIAFKDMALSILPHLLITSARKNQVKNDIVILTATSGDTGKAALAGFADVEGTKIVVFYPKNGVSPIQEKQMITQKGANTCVVGIHGNFDQAQTGVKKMFNDTALEAELDVAGYQFSSANSINIGRLVPQVVYYVYAYAKLLQNEEIAEDEEINVVVPTGNFGNILAAYYAKQMGLPVHKLICASNDNKVLYDFFRTGTYDRKRDFILTTSPSMDILISSNTGSSAKLVHHDRHMDLAGTEFLQEIVDLLRLRHEIGRTDQALPTERVRLLHIRQKVFDIQDSLDVILRIGINRNTGITGSDDEIDHGAETRLDVDILHIQAGRHDLVGSLVVELDDLRKHLFLFRHFGGSEFQCFGKLVDRKIVLLLD